MDLNIETPFGICDKTGWVHGYFCNGIDDIINDFGDITDQIEYDIEHDGVGKFRPKSLQVIEDNNGWIKIESENDLPKEYGEYYTISSFDNTISEKKYPHPKFSNDFNKEWWLKYITHYQPIIKPDLPLY